jgi:hypothetical protein
MALRAITAKGVAVGTIVAVVTSASLLLRLPRRSVGPAPLLAAHSLPVVAVSLPGLPRVEHEQIAPEPRADVVTAVATPEPIRSRTLTSVVHARSEVRGDEVRAATMSVDEAQAPLLASRPIAVVLLDASGEEQATSAASRPGAITRAMGTTGRAFRVAGTSVANAFRKVF